MTTTVHTLEVPDATLHYELRGAGPMLLLVGAPMGVSFFAPMADLLAEHYTVVTTDPRGIGRSRLCDPTAESTPELRADDLHRIIIEINAGGAAVFGSSGGAVTGLALVSTHPEQVNTLVAHEPPLVGVLEDRDQLRARLVDIHETYLREGQGPAWEKFLAVIFGTDQPPAPDPQWVALMPEPEQQVADGAYMLGHTMLPTTLWQPDLARLRAVPSRIVVGVGETSTGELCERTATALAGLLGVERVAFPGGHAGFVPDPAGFAEVLRHTLVAAADDQ